MLLLSIRRSHARLIHLVIFLIIADLVWSQFTNKEMSSANMEETKNTPIVRVVEEIPGFLRVYSNGSIWRSNKPGIEMPVHDDGSILWKDVVFDVTNNLQLRLYKPASPAGKLPILYYFHGGGFVLGSRTWPNIQNYCLKLASDLQAVIISPDNRLAPENRLPAAIEDGYTAMKWLMAQATAKEPDAWLTDVADFRHVFIVGDSSGGNIAHHLAVRLGPSSAELAPVRVVGYVLLAPFFGGKVLTKSEIETPKDAPLNLEAIMRFWRLSIPLGETRDNAFVNPFGPKSPNLEKTELSPILVVAGGSDILKDRVKNYADNLKKWGKKVVYLEFAGQQHGFNSFFPDSEASKELMLAIKKFKEENSS